MSLALAALLSTQAIAGPLSNVLETEPPEPSNHSLSVTVRPLAFTQGLASLQVDFRMSEKVAVVGHGFAGQTFNLRTTKESGPVERPADPTSLTTSPVEGQASVSQTFARRAGAGLGLKYSLRNFDRGVFVGFDLDVSQEHYDATLEVLELGGQERDIAGVYYQAHKTGDAMAVRAIPRVGWKITGQRGLTFCADVGVGYRHVLYHSVDLFPEQVNNPLTMRAGTRVGWSF